MPNILVTLIACSKISALSDELQKNPEANLWDLITILKKMEIIEEDDEVLVHLD